MKVALSIVLVALIAAGVFSAAASQEPFESRMIRLETQRVLPSLADELAGESPAINAIFLAYADRQDADRSVLWAAAWLAIRNHGDLAREALADFGLDPDFQRVLVRFGAGAVLPVIYYRDHDIATLRAQRWLGTRYREASGQLGRWWGDDSDNPDDGLREPDELSMTPARRGQIAIAILQVKGHAFLQQFVVTPDNEVSWLQSERLMSDVGDFFTSGLRDLERQWRRGDAIGVADIGWAGVDLLVMTSAVKALRSGRAIRAGAAVEGQGARTAGRGLLAGGGRFVNLSRAAKVAAVAGTVYVVVRHPSLVSALGANVAKWLGWPVWLGQFVLWLVVLLPLLVVARLLYRWVAAPLLWLLVPLLKATSTTPRRMTASRKPPLSGSSA